MQPSPLSYSQGWLNLAEVGFSYTYILSLPPFCVSLQARGPTWFLAEGMSFTLTAAAPEWNRLFQKIISVPCPVHSRLMEPPQHALFLQTKPRWVVTVSDQTRNDVVSSFYRHTATLPEEENLPLCSPQPIACMWVYLKLRRVFYKCIFVACKDAFICLAFRHMCNYFYMIYFL